MNSEEVRQMYARIASGELYNLQENHPCRCDACYEEANLLPRLFVVFCEDCGERDCSRVKDHRNKCDKNGN